MSYDVAALRETEFPWAHRGECIYLNNASTGPLPASSVRALAEFNARRAEPWRLSYEEERDIAARCRAACAALIGAEAEEIALAINTGFGINLAARALPLRAGDVVVAPDREFPANVYPWMALESRGVRFERLPCVDGAPDEEALLRAVERPEVRVLTVSWVSFATGHRVDLAALGDACAAHDTFLVVDAMQGLGAAAIDVAGAGVHVLACGGQKWLLSPWGTGFVYVRRELIASLEPPMVGWQAVRASDQFERLVDYELSWHDDARRFETQTLPLQDFVAMTKSLDLLERLGPAAVEAHVSALVAIAVAWCAERRDVRLVTPSDPRRRAGIVSLVPADARRVSARLEAARIAHAFREGAIRIAPHCYNTADDLHQALELIGAR